MEKPKVLIVEDNHINAVVMQRAVRHICEPLLATRDAEVFDLLEAHPDIITILMDINLGGGSLDGEAIMHRLREDPRYAQMRIFAVTGYANPGDRERFLAAGFDYYYPKPIERHKILETLESVLQLPAGDPPLT